MQLADALQELTTQLDVLCTTTQGRLATRLARQQTRLEHCTNTLRVVTLGIQQTHRDLAHENATLTRELADARATHKKLHARIQREKQDRSDEREWLATLWPDGVVLPTLLKPFVPTPTSATVGQVDATAERARLNALVNRRVARELVLQQMEVAAQWKVVVVPPSTTPEGTSVAAQVFYENRVTGESAWDAPAAMGYEPPPHWDARKMDWKDGYALDHWYAATPPVGAKAKADTDESSSPPTEQAGLVPVTVSAASQEATTPPDDHTNHDNNNDDYNDDDGDSTDDDESDDQVVATGRSRLTARTDRRSSDDDDDDAPPPDPVALRAELQAAFDHTAQLQTQLHTSQAQQRALSLQLLNATRDSFDREKETLAIEDQAVKDAERARRRAQQEELAAAEASRQAQQRKALTEKVQPTFARDTVAKKDLTLAKDHEQLELELQAFAVEQRRDRLYLAAPLATDARVKFRRQFDDEFVHVKHMEQQMLALEQTEFDLLEKTAQRLEDATTQSETLLALLDETRDTLRDVDAELALLPQQIAALEAQQSPPPTAARPDADVLARARDRYVFADDDAANTTTADDGDEEEEEEGGDQDQAARAATKAKESTETEAVAVETKADEEEEDEEEDDDEKEEDTAATAVTATIAPAELDPALVARDEAELTQLRDAVALDKQWRDWERTEAQRLETLATAYDRFEALDARKRRLVVDVALLESDHQFIEQVAAREQDVSALLWDIQARAQVERARFLVERAAREESLFQVQDAHAAVAQRLDAARLLPRQAQNALEKLELLAQSKQQAAALQDEVARLQARYATEQQAAALLATLETRFCTYARAKLDEEAALLAERQTLWELHTTLQTELRATREQVEALYRGHADAAATATATAVFHEQLQRLESVRQFVLLCYARETRWRTLAAVALVPDTTSDAWLTATQRERHEATLAALQTQHDAELHALRRELKLHKSVEALLQQEVATRDAQLTQLRLEYQQSRERVRRETEQIILELRDHLDDEVKARADERTRAQRERRRLLQDHDACVAELQQGIATLEQQYEQQTHWLTAATRELHAQRVANEALLVGYGSLERRRATETNDMRFRIAAQITKLNGIEMWNAALRLQAQAAHAARVQQQRELTSVVARHQQQQRLLRLATWRQRVTAQTILTDVDALFAFFADGLALVAGATPATNDALRRNGGIDVLAALARHSDQREVRAVAAAALGAVAWNTNVTPRALGFAAKQRWRQCEQRYATRVLEALAQQQQTFDSVASEASDAMNWCADTTTASGEADETDQLTTKKLRFLQRWNARDAVARPSVNAANHTYIGLAPGVLTTLLDLCRGGSGSGSVGHDTDMTTMSAIQRNALRSLALVAMSTRNTAILGRLDGCIPMLVSLLRRGAIDEISSPDDAACVRHAVHALANLAVANASNQHAIVRAGAVPLLLAIVAGDTDVDLLRASVDALAAVSHDHHAACAAIFDAHGLTVLTQLCGTARIHDAIELEAFEAIQASAARTVANVVTMLTDDDDHDHDIYNDQQYEDRTVERDVARAILDASLSRTTNDDELSDTPGVATFVLLCASCTRDVAFHGALVLGAIARHDDVRAAIGASGGVDALFLLAAQHATDAALARQATWVLTHVTWHRENQYRVARYLDALYALATFYPRSRRRNKINNSNRQTTTTTNNNHEAPERDDRDDDNDDRDADRDNNNDNDNDDDNDDAADDDDVAVEIRAHALCVLANALFYNDANRLLVAASTPWMTLLAHLCRSGSTGNGDAGSKGSSSSHNASLEHAARALCSLSYNDAIALALGGSSTSSSSSSSNTARETDTALAPARAVHGLALFVTLCGHRDRLVVQQHALFGLINLCLHDASKAALLAVPHAIETLVHLSGATARELREPALEALDLLADVRDATRTLVGTHPAAVVASSTLRALAASDLQKLITLLQDAAASPALIAMACDAIADDVWQRPSAKVRLRNERGLDALLVLCSSDGRAATSERLLLSCLWALRNAVADNARNQDYVGALGGVARLVALCDRTQHRHSDEVVEAALAALVALVMTHPRNSQELVVHGVDVLLPLADALGETQRDDEDDDDNEEEEGRREHGTRSAAAASTGTQSPSKVRSPQARSRAQQATTKPQASQANRALAQQLLLLLSPYSNPTPLPALVKRVPSPKKAPVHEKTSTRLPSLGVASGSPLAAPVSPPKRVARSNN